MKINISIIFFLFSGILNAQIFTKNYQYNYNLVKPIGVIQQSNQSLIIVSNATDGSMNDIIVTKTNLDNTVVWSKNYGSVLNGIFKAYSFIVDRAGDIVVVGAQENVASIIFKINSNNGNLIFGKTLNFRNRQPSNRYYKIVQMRAEFSDDYILIGSVNFPATHTVSRISTTGTVLWSNEYDVSGGNELLYALEQTNNGDILLGGHFSNGGHFDHSFLRIKSLDGSLLKIMKYDLAFNGGFNGGFDEAIAIKGTDFIAFSTVINGNGNRARQGAALYNTRTDQLTNVVLYDIGDDARSFSMAFDSLNQKLIIGGIFTNTDNHFYQVIDINNLSNCLTYKIKDINFGTQKSGIAYISLNKNHQLLISTFKSNNSNPNICSSVIGMYDLGLNQCVDKINTSVYNINIPAPTIPTHALTTRHTHGDMSFVGKNNTIVITTLCEVNCFATKKEFRIASTKKIDTICFNQAYSWTVSTASNPKDSSLNFVLYKKNGTALLPLDSIKNKTGKTFNLPYSSNNETYIVIAKTKCSFNDTVILNLVAHKLSVSTLLHNNYYCKNETVNLSSDYTASGPKKVAFRWFDSTTNKMLDSFSSLQIRADFSQSIGLTVNDQCAGSKTIYTRFYVAPLISDSLILTKKMDCEPLKTELVHPKTVANGTMSFKFKWMWQMDGTVIDSTETEAGKTEPNRPLTIAQSGFYKLKTYMALPNSKVCVVFNDTARVVKKAVANFNINPEFIDISKGTVVFNNFSNYAFKYQWTISDGGSYSDMSPNHTFNKIGVYNVSLIAYSISGCNDTLSKTLTVNDIYNIYIPNSFTPNGDGNNNVWKPEIISGDKIDLEIFNRWGELIYHSKDESASWDGTYKNEICQEGMYLYMFKVTSKTKKIYYYRGMISLLR